MWMRACVLALAVVVLGCEDGPGVPDARGDASLQGDGGDASPPGDSGMDSAAAVDAASGPYDSGRDGGEAGTDAQVAPDAGTELDGGQYDGSDARDGGPRDDGSLHFADGSAGSARGTCLTTRAAADPSVLFLPGKSGNGLVDFGETVLGYTLGNPEMNELVGWTLWRKATGELVNDCEFGGNPNVATGTFLSTAGQRFLVRERMGGPTDLVLRDGRDGSEKWRKSGWSPLGPKLTTSYAGVAPGGEYVWAASALYADSASTMVEAYDVASNSDIPFVSVTVAGTALKSVLATDEELIVVVGDSTSTTLRRFSRTSELAQVGPLVGTYSSTFADGSHFVTAGAGNILRVYSRAGELKFQKTLPAPNSLPLFNARGIGDSVVWPTAGAVELYRLNDSSTPYATATGVVAAAVDGAPSFNVQQNSGSPARADFSGTVLLLGASSYRVAPLTAGAVHVVNRADMLTQTTWQGIEGASLPNRLGCGPLTATAADATRLYISTAGGGTFVFEAPFDAPVARLPSATTILPSRNASRVALRISDTEVAVYERNFEAVGTYQVVAGDQGVPAQISLSFDGTKLGTSRVVNPTARRLRSEVIDLTTRAVVWSFEQVAAAGIAPLFAAAPRFSPSGSRLSAGAAASSSLGGDRYPSSVLFDGMVQRAVIDGQVSLWVNDSTVLARPVDGASLMNADGIRIGAFACMLPPQGEPSQWLSTSSWLEGAATCDAAANTLTPEPAVVPLVSPPWVREHVVARFGNQAVYVRDASSSVRLR